MRNSKGKRLGRFAGVVLLASALGLTGCDLDQLLEVTDRDRVTEGTLFDPDNLQILVNGAMGEFTVAFGAGDGYVTLTGLIADEFFSSGTFTTRTATDRRNQFQPANGNTTDGTYVNLHQARRALKDAAAQVAEVEGTSDPRFAELKTLQAYTYVMLAEGWCNAVPISNLEGTDFVYGQPQTSAALFNQAVPLFDEALAASPGYPLALVGKGRAQVMLGNHAAAASTVATVDTDFNYFVFFSVSGAGNPVFNQQSNGRYSLSDVEGGNGAPFRSAMDPRSPWEDAGGGFDPSIPLFLTLKYTSTPDDIVLASGVEARLIQAEADLQAPAYGAMTAKLNTLRANAGALLAAQGMDVDPALTMPALAAPTTAADAREMLFEERAFWLLLTGHRMADLRRLVYQYGLQQAAVYPSGAYHKGGDYGDDVVFPIDFDETNNPNFSVEMCDVGNAGITG
ncbi:MAG TPA: tetratricopeptide repeat protein [Longimicrobiales bacterium]|nr:tetratricopeptide repeat protein [Longimicrobiales bacterium]